MKIAFLASETPKAQESLKSLVARYGQYDPLAAEVMVVLGGDGFMLQCLHQYMKHDIPVFGLRRGTVGFLMNDYSDDDLLGRIENAQQTILHPLLMQATNVAGEAVESLAINEVSLLRQTKQSAHIQIKINDQVKIENLVGDGVMVATPAGSTAYNLSVHGPVIPLGSQILALTPISPFRPRRWRGAIIPSHAEVTFDILSHQKRPVSATADNTEVRDVKKVVIKESKKHRINALYDPLHNLEDRIINEQFS
ncbi:NAD kinase [Marinicella meishanensis]|uniref:NAD kinase n=1 Tax=Marinicella meishanensis TaxID=2873263 RepID=UPI0021066DD8|nr:NAD kinase [Marinicella sp. NBU2979]